MNRFFHLVVLSTVLLAMACGGGGGGGSGTSYTADYTEPPNTDAGNVVLNLNTGGATLVFNVVAYGPLTNVHDIAFHLQYDPAILEYQSASEGTVLDDGVCSGSCTEFLIDSTEVSDKIIVGLARTAPGAGVDLPSGANVVMTLTFDPVAVTVGPAAFDFVAGTRELEDVDAVDLSTGWFAGTSTAI